MRAAEKVDWRQRCEDLENPHEAYERLHEKNRDEYNFAIHVANLKQISSDPEARTRFLRPSEMYQAVIKAAYNEGIETMRPSIEAVKNSTFPTKRIIFVLGYE